MPQPVMFRREDRIAYWEKVAAEAPYRASMKVNAAHDAGQTPAARFPVGRGPRLLRRRPPRQRGPCRTGLGEHGHPAGAQSESAPRRHRVG